MWGRLGLEMAKYKLTWVAWGEEHEKICESEEELIVNYEMTVLNAFNGSKAFVDDKCILSHKIHGWVDCEEEKRIRAKWNGKNLIRDFYKNKEKLKNEERNS